MELRKNLINDINLDIEDKFMLETQVTSVEKLDGYYKIICKNLKKINSVELEIKCKYIIFGTGRFGALFIKSNIPWIPLEFKRVEIGVRVEGVSTHPIFNISSNTDPKFIKQIDLQTQIKTFCWCRSGVKTKYDESRYETELDNYTSFDKIIINNESIDELSVKIIL